MTEFVAVDSRSPAPKPISRRPGTTSPYIADGVETAEACHKPAAIAARPAATVNLIPISRATIRETAALTNNMPAIGKMRSPASSGE